MSAARFGILLFLSASLGGEAHASSRDKALYRFKVRCDDGSGKACYDAGQLYWARRENHADRKIALRYFARGCQLKYSYACDIVAANSTTSVHIHNPNEKADGVGDICFTVAQFGSARLIAHTASTGVARGLRIEQIKANSFWDRAGLKNGDIVVKANNMPFNNSREAEHALSTSGKKFGFEVVRADETITLWYSCK